MTRQLLIELDNETAHKAAEAASAAHMKTGEWIAALVRTRTTGNVDPGWPADVSALAGAWPDFPEGDVLRTSPGSDVQRETW